MSEWDVRTRGYVVVGSIRFSLWRGFFEKAVNNNREKSTDVYAPCLLHCRLEHPDRAG
jgi:hypothetical protein